MDLLVKDSSASQVSDQIKNILFTKSAEKIEAPVVANSVFANSVFTNPFEVDGEEQISDDELETSDGV